MPRERRSAGRHDAASLPATNSAQFPGWVVVILAATDVTKKFGGQVALDNASITIGPGSVHALAGENGAGKSTLIRILAGVHEPDQGVISVNGDAVRLRSPRDAQALRIGCVHQQLHLVPTMSVRENVLLGTGYPTQAKARIEWRTVNEQVRQYLELVELDVSEKRRVRDLRPAQQQQVALARALAQKPEVLILDEPTAALGASDSEHLLALIGGYRDAGVAILFVSHRIDEILKIADVVTVLKDGRIVATRARQELTRPLLVRLLGGAPPEDTKATESSATSPEGNAREPRLRVRDVVGSASDVPVTFAIDSGEVVGLAGLVGSGRSRLARILAGIDAAASGEITLDGKAVQLKNHRDALRQGIAFVPSDRNAALIQGFGVAENISLGHVRRYSWHGLVLRRRRERAAARHFVEKLRIKTSHGDRAVRALSGGNQQKVLFARALDVGPKLLILDEPTAGIDVGTKEYIYSLTRELAEAGMSILFISSELEELPVVCDRILVFHRGRILDELPGRTTRGAIVARLFAETGEAGDLDAVAS
jgi:ABC-type sugar transport system ATPase subunit